MTQEEMNEIKNFIEEKKFIARRTDGWSFFWSGDAISVEDLMRKLKNIMRRKANR